MGDVRERGKLDGAQVRRSYPARFEVRGATGSTVKVAGYATVYNTPYDMYDWMGGYTEEVADGAGKKTLSEDPQVQLLENHTGRSMAYTRANTLNLSEDTTGLAVEADVDTRRTDVRDMVYALERGDVDEMSFAFRVTRQEWNEDYTHRWIREYNLHRGDVSVVNFGANSATDVGVRAQELARLSTEARSALASALCPHCAAERSDVLSDPGATVGADMPLGLALVLAQAQG